MKKIVTEEELDRLLSDIDVSQEVGDAEALNYDVVRRLIIEIREYRLRNKVNVNLPYDWDMEEQFEKITGLIDEAHYLIDEIDKNP